MKRIAAGTVWFFTIIVYYCTLAPSVGYIDSGELATVANTLGIAHPTGYPLYTLVARVISVIPISTEVIVRLNFLSALLTASAVLIFFFVVIELLEEEKKSTPGEIIISAAISSMILAFSKTFWQQGVSAEVYSLHLVLICLVLLFFIKAIKMQEHRWWLLFAFIVGLSFTNHMTTILLAPALLYWFFAEHGINKDALKKISLLSLPFFSGLSVYLFLPVRASQHPLLNWGNPQTVESFWWHVTGKQFRVWMFSSGDVAKKQLDYFFGNLPNEFHAVVLIVALVGAIALLFTDRRKFIVMVLLFVSCVAYSVNYDIHDIDSYFLLAFIVIGVFSAYGGALIMRRFEQRNVKITIGTFWAALVIIQANGNWDSADQSSNYMVEDYTKSILNNLPPNAIVISSQWDYFISAAYYYQHVDKIRTDVVILDKELFRRTWYFPQLEQLYPDVIQRSFSEISEFKKELFKFEHDLPYDYSVIEGRYAAFLKSIVEKNASLPVYTTSEIESQYTAGFLRIPEGFVFRLTQDTVYQPMDQPRFIFRMYDGTDIYTKSLKSLMVRDLLYRASYESYYGKDTLSAFYSKKASEFATNSHSQVSKF